MVHAYLILSYLILAPGTADLRRLRCGSSVISVIAGGSAWTLGASRLRPANPGSRDRTVGVMDWAPQLLGEHVFGPRAVLIGTLSGRSHGISPAAKL